MPIHSPSSSARAGPRPLRPRADAAAGILQPPRPKHPSSRARAPSQRILPVGQVRARLVHHLDEPLHELVVAPGRGRLQVLRRYARHEAALVETPRADLPRGEDSVLVVVHAVREVQDEELAEAFIPRRLRHQRRAQVVANSGNLARDGVAVHLQDPPPSLVRFPVLLYFQRRVVPYGRHPAQVLLVNEHRRRSDGVHVLNLLVRQVLAREASNQLGEALGVDVKERKCRGSSTVHEVCQRPQVEVVGLGHQDVVLLDVAALLKVLLERVGPGQHHEPHLVIQPVHHARRYLVHERVRLVVQDPGESTHLAPVGILLLAPLPHALVPVVHHADLPRLVYVRVCGDEHVKLLVRAALAANVRGLRHRSADPRVGLVADTGGNLRPALALEPARARRLGPASALQRAVHPHVAPAVVSLIRQELALVVALPRRSLDVGLSPFHDVAAVLGVLLTTRVRVPRLLVGRI
mmetsp:Transcript_9562/g.39116  ORF Transcript_9562/g.39116 Transcript_9562/m.39116 type:complete len:465 (-) Transcript_9562:130-1524(-)